MRRGLRRLPWLAAGLSVASLALVPACGGSAIAMTVCGLLPVAWWGLVWVVVRHLASARSSAEWLAWRLSGENWLVVLAGAQVMTQLAPALLIGGAAPALPRWLVTTGLIGTLAATSLALWLPARAVHVLATGYALALLVWWAPHVSEPLLLGFTAFVVCGSIALVASRLRQLETRWRAETTRSEVLSRRLEDSHRLRELANMKKTQLIATTSHDLRQPVHALGLLVQRLRPDVTPREAAALHGAIRSRVTVLADMLSSMLDLSRLDDNAYEPRHELLSLPEVLQEVHEIYLENAAAKGLQLKVNAPPISLTTDPQLFRRILYNLMSNAVKYTERGFVRVDCHTSASSLSIVFTDSGPGIPSTMLKDIFVEYYRLPATRDTQEGLGVGLSVVERIAGLLGYHVKVRSRLGFGSQFIVTIPIEQITGAAPLEPATTDPMYLNTRDSGTPQDCEILLVENDPISNESTASLLTDWGYKVSAHLDVLGACQAVELARTVPDLIISDLHLGRGMNGLEGLAQLRRLLGEPRLPAILLTGDLTARIDPLSMPVHVMHKPLRPSLLRTMVRELLRA
jgi:signal transduction histidine kinase/CheY-like chemotaxis protein